MIVKNLIKVLEKVDPNLPIVLCVYDHSYHSIQDRNSHGPLKIGYYHRGYDDTKPGKTPKGLLLANVYKDKFNYPNDWMGEVIDVDGTKDDAEY
jgi:hypothetical protein